MGAHCQTIVAVHLHKVPMFVTSFVLNQVTVEIH